MVYKCKEKKLQNASREAIAKSTDKTRRGGGVPHTRERAGQNKIHCKRVEADGIRACGMGTDGDGI